MTKRHYTHWTKKEIRMLMMLARSGYSRKEIAKIMNIPAHRVYQKIYHLNIHVRDERVQLVVDEEKIEHWRNLLHEGAMIKEIAAQEGFSSTAIQYHLNQRNLSKAKIRQEPRKKKDKRRLPCMIPYDSVNQCFHSRCYLHKKCPKYVENLNNKIEGVRHG